MGIVYLSSVLLLHCFIASLAMTAKNSTIDQFALLAFKAQITWDPQNVLRYNWSISNPLCKWVGISCGAYHGRVTALNLSSMGLGGTIPAHIGNLSFLAYLDLGDNNFTGHLPNELGKLRRLVVLNFQNNKLSGVLPPEIGKLPNLKEFDMGQNQLSGSIPWTIYNISSLRKIDFSFNSLSGRLPDDLCNRLPKLEMLGLSANRLSDHIPLSIGSCGELQTLWLIDNRFTETIPENMGNLSKLENLGISGNNFTKGPFSSKILSISLKFARLGQSGFFGSIPADICRRLPEIEELYLDGNHLSGNIPKDITNCTSLKFLTLRANEFTEYGSTGIVSLRGDVYSFGVLMMETFTRKKPSDEMFSGEMSLKHYVESSLPHAITEVMDANLLQDPNTSAATIDCLLSIMDLALDCTRELAAQRINMKDVVVKLKKIKMKFVKDIGAK